MRTWWMAWIALALLAAATVAAQAEVGEGLGRLIERPYTAIGEIMEDGTDWAGEVPFSGATSEFGGRCSVPSDWVFHMSLGGLDSVFGAVTGTASHCAQVAWGIDAEGAPMPMGIAFTDGVFALGWSDGSSIGGSIIDLGMGFDAETGLITLSNFQSSAGDGTGRLAGATLFYVADCRYGSDAGVIAGTESVLCSMHGTIRYDPLAGAGQ